MEKAILILPHTCQTGWHSLNLQPLLHGCTMKVPAVLCLGSLEHFERLPVGRVPLLAASLVTALTTYFLGCQMLFFAEWGGSHGDSFPYCRDAPTARLSRWWLRLCLETPSHPRTLCRRLPACRAGVPAAHPAGPVRLSLPEDRWMRAAPGRGCCKAGRSRQGACPARRGSRRRRGGRERGRRAMDRDLGRFPCSPRHAPACLTPLRNDSEAWRSISSSCRRFTLRTQFSPKMLPAGISVPRFHWQEGGRSHLWAQGGTGTRRVLGALGSWERPPQRGKGVGFLLLQLHSSPYK